MPGADPSIYGNVQTPQINIPNPLDMAQKSMQLSQLGMQQMQMARQLRNQSDMQDAYMRNTDPQTGQLDQGGVLSTLGKTNPMLAQQAASTFASQNEATAKAQSDKVDAAQKTLGIVGPAFDYMAGLPEDQRAAAYPNIVQQLKAQGVNAVSIDHPYDPGLFNQYIQNWHASKPGLEQQVLAASIPAKRAEIQSNLFGSRSPNAELTSQYNAQAKSVQGSQMAMNQMLDNYKNPSPQGDASLILNAFKIKFPNVPDVNSLEELSKSQAAPDQWKQWANKSISGGLDTNTRDNLMRDGISTFRANVTTLRGIQQKLQARQTAQGVNDPSLTYEPGIDQTFQQTQDLQKQLGPYVPPSQRGGALGAVSDVLSKIAGTGGNQSAKAASGPGASDLAALNWLKTADPSSKEAFGVRAKLRARGFLPSQPQGSSSSAGGQ